MAIPVTLCGLVTEHQVADCDKKPEAGVEKRIYVINRDHWRKAAIVRDATNPKIIKSITLPVVATVQTYAYAYIGLPKSVGNKATFARQTFNSGWSHECPYMIFRNDPSTKVEIDKLPEGQYVIVVENEFQGEDGDHAFEVLGEKHGLELAKCDRDANNNDNGGAWDALFKTPDGKTEKVPSTFQTFTSPSTAYNYADSLAALDALLAP